MLAVTTWQWNMIMFCEFDCLMKPDNIQSSFFVVVFFESYLKCYNFIAGTSWVSRLWCRVLSSYFHPAVALAPAPPSRQGDVECGVRGQVWWTDTAPCHQPDSTDHTFAMNCHQPDQNAELQPVYHRTPVPVMIWSPNQCPPGLLSPAPWHHGTRGPTFCWADLLFYIDRAQPVQAA